MSNINFKVPFINFNIKLKKKLYSKLVMSRNFKITPKCVGSTFKIYNGKTYTNLLITYEMVGHKFGEFVTTRDKFVFKKKKQQKKITTTKHKH